MLAALVVLLRADPPGQPHHAHYRGAGIDLWAARSAMCTTASLMARWWTLSKCTSSSYHWPDFNVADCSIVTGACLLLLDSLLPKNREQGTGIRDRRALLSIGNLAKARDRSLQGRNSAASAARAFGPFPAYNSCVESKHQRNSKVFRHAGPRP